MSRKYIDAEALIQEAIESKHSYLGDPMMVSQHDLMCDNTISWIDGAETADVVEVVRCRYCRHSSSNGLSSNTNITFHNCHVHHTTVTGDYYCGDGERKEE